MPSSVWTPRLYFQNPARRVQDDPKLLSISRFRRYGANDCFEFLATFEHPEAGKKPKRGWIKYKDLACNPVYMTFLEIHGWVMEDEQDKYEDDLQIFDDAAAASDEEPVTIAPQPKKTGLQPSQPVHRSEPKWHPFPMKKKQSL